MKPMIRLLVLGVFVHFSIVSPAQFRAGIATGLNISYLERENVTTKAQEFLFSIPFSLLINKTLNKNYGFQAELNYVRMGERINGLQEISPAALPAAGLPPGTCAYASFRNDIYLDYVQVPLLLRATIQFHPLVTYYALLGPSVSILASASTVLNGSSLLYKDIEGIAPPETDLPRSVSFKHALSIREQFKPFGFSGIGAAGIQINGKAGSFFLEARMTAGFTNIYPQPQENYTKALACLVGYTFIINK